jgi:hypothetical protein
MKNLPFDPYDFFGYLASGLLILVGMELALGFPHLIGQKLTAVDSLMVLLAAYVAGQLSATPAKALLEQGLAAQLLGRPSENLVSGSSPNRARWLFRDYFTPLPLTARDGLTAKLAKAGFDGDGEDLFIFVRYAPEIRSDSSLMSRLDMFRNRYGFARNLAFASLVVGTALLAVSCAKNNGDVFRYGLVALVASVLLVYRFLKFFRMYSFELFNTYARLE